ncbi:MAG: hypothetical protein OEY38_01500 [Gammaproteobacteria bacterium]|nr:hypothetical protein [Gammaproteobacteria bacterium]
MRKIFLLLLVFTPFLVRAEFPLSRATIVEEAYLRVQASEVRSAFELLLKYEFLFNAYASQEYVLGIAALDLGDKQRAQQIIEQVIARYLSSQFKTQLEDAMHDSEDIMRANHSLLENSTKTKSESMLAFVDTDDIAPAVVKPSLKSKVSALVASRSGVDTNAYAANENNLFLLTSLNSAGTKDLSIYSDGLTRFNWTSEIPKVKFSLDAYLQQRRHFYAESVFTGLRGADVNFFVAKGLATLDLHMAYDQQRWDGGFNADTSVAQVSWLFPRASVIASTAIFKYARFRAKAAYAERSVNQYLSAVKLDYKSTGVNAFQAELGVNAAYARAVETASPFSHYYAGGYLQLLQPMFVKIKMQISLRLDWTHTLFTSGFWGFNRHDELKLLRTSVDVEAFRNWQITTGFSYSLNQSSAQAYTYNRLDLFLQVSRSF